MSTNMLSVKRIPSLLGAWLIAAGAALMIFNHPAVLDAQDWPQINGPTRNGVAYGESLFPDWPADGPEQIWSHPVGQGFAGPAIKDNQLVIFHRPGKNNLVELLEADTGNLIWKREVASSYKGRGPDGDNGPKAVPLIQGNRIFLLGTGGNLFCLSLADGKTIWEKNVAQLYRSPSGYFGAGSSPMIVGNYLLVMVGGENAAVVAFDVETGKEVWKSFDDRATYSSPIEATIGGNKVVFFLTRLYLIGLDPGSGEVVYQTEFGKRGTNAIGAMPVFVDDHLFINAAYGMGARWIDLTGKKLNEVWGNDSSFSSHFSTPIFLNGHLYGTAGRVDYQNGSYRCVEAATGKVVWEKADFPVGHTLLVDDKLLVLGSGGELSLLAPSPASFWSMKSAKLFDKKAFAMPAFVNGRLYARSNADGGTAQLACYQLGESK